MHRWIRHHVTRGLVAALLATFSACESDGVGVEDDATHVSEDASTEVAEADADASPCADVVPTHCDPPAPYELPFCVGDDVAVTDQCYDQCGGGYCCNRVLATCAEGCFEEPITGAAACQESIPDYCRAGSLGDVSFSVTVDGASVPSGQLDFGGTIATLDSTGPSLQTSDGLVALTLQVGVAWTTGLSEGDEASIVGATWVGSSAGGWVAVLDDTGAPRVAASYMTEALGSLLGVALAFGADEICMPYVYRLGEPPSSCPFGHYGRNQLDVTLPGGDLVSVHLGEPANIETSFGTLRFTNVTGYEGEDCRGFGILVTRP